MPGCQWIFGEAVPADGSPPVFCNRACEPGESWCAEHRAIVFTDPERRADELARWRADPRNVGGVQWS